MAIPRWLFHYQPLTTETLDNLASCRISLRGLATLGDAFDFASLKDLQVPGGTDQAVFNAARPAAVDPVAFDARYLTAGVPNNQFRADVQQRRDLVQRLAASRIARFSEDNQVNQIWDHDAAGHSGICLRFDAAQQPFASAEQVTYGKLFPTRKPLAQLDVPEPGDFHASFLEKADYYAYEQEWRILDTTGASSLSYNPTALDRVYFGARASQWQRVIKSIILAIPGGHRPELYQFEAWLNRPPMGPSSFLLDSFNVTYVIPPV